MTVAIPKTLGPYPVVSLLGRGGMASVFRVVNPRLGSIHALKILNVTDPRIRERFVREGRVQANLRHPNILSVQDVVDTEAGPALLLELVEGPTLEQFLNSAPRMTVAQIDALALGVIRGVRAIHEARCLHRDLKPGNILLATHGDAIVPKISDFGLARDADGDRMTLAGQILGTPNYMAPEQTRDASAVDARADLFSLGCILYEIVTGDLAFPGTDLFAILEAIRKSDPVPIVSIRPDAPGRMVDAIDGCLRKDAGARIQLAQDVEACWLGGQPGESTWGPDALRRIAQAVPQPIVRPPTPAEGLKPAAIAPGLAGARTVLLDGPVVDEGLENVRLLELDETGQAPTPIDPDAPTALLRPPAFGLSDPVDVDAPTRLANIGVPAFAETPPAPLLPVTFGAPRSWSDYAEDAATVLRSIPSGPAEVRRATRSARNRVAAWALVVGVSALGVATAASLVVLGFLLVGALDPSVSHRPGSANVGAPSPRAEAPMPEPTVPAAEATVATADPPAKGLPLASPVPIPEPEPPVPNERTRTPPVGPAPVVDGSVVPVPVDLVAPSEADAPTGAPPPGVNDPPAEALPPAAEFRVAFASVPAGASLIVDGTRLGVTPMVVPALAAGVHHVVMELDGQATQHEIEIGAESAKRHVWRGGSDWDSYPE